MARPTCATYGYGKGFSLTATGDESVLYRFGGPAGDAIVTCGGLISDKQEDQRYTTAVHNERRRPG